MITFHESARCFHLYNRTLSCILLLEKDEAGCESLLMPYIGEALPDDALPVYQNEWPEGASFDSSRTRRPDCCPTEGRGDYRPAMICAVDPDGNRTTELFYTGVYTIAPGKPALPGLPATYTESDAEAETLTLILRDPHTGLEAALRYTLFADLPALAASVTLTNTGDRPLTLTQAGSLTLPLPGRYDLLHLHGAWARERQVERVPAATLTRTLESCRGASGHQHNPFAVLMSPDATEFSGVCCGVSLVYSGDFRISVDENAYSSTRLVAGLNPRTFCWRLAPGASFHTPEAVCVYSARGLNAMSQTFHTLYRTRLCRGPWRDRERPILVNNWEATYFDFDREKLLGIARVAADLGIELFVLDDGWFGRRSSDTCSLGDWVVDRRKLPDGLDALAREINALGLRFGLWFEPEMVSPDSDLYRAHPDWCLHVGDRRRTTARNQLILDMSRGDVRRHVIDAVNAVLDSAPIGYVKWDMNRNFAEAGSALLRDGRGGELAHRYMLGVYSVMEAITSAHPEILFESCSGGGGRFDAGMLYYMPQTWTSDDTDAVERLRIQYGTSIAYPAGAMGAHVSAVPNHQVGRTTPIKARGDVALGGNFGYELDLSRQSESDLAAMREQIALVRTLRNTIRSGVFTRLISPFDGQLAAWQFADDRRVILCVYRIMAMPNPPSLRICLRDLPEDALYRYNGRTYSARTLMLAGIVPDLAPADYASCVMVFDRC